MECVNLFVCDDCDQEEFGENPRLCEWRAGSGSARGGVGRRSAPLSFRSSRERCHPSCRLLPTSACGGWS